MQATLQISQDFWKQLGLHKQVAIVGGGICGILLLRRLFKKPQGLHVPDYEKDVVYLFQFPSSTTCPTISPFALKLETWLRWQGVPYKDIRGTYLKSKYGQIPFIELNGEQIADSNVIIQALQKKRGQSDDLPTEQQSVAHAFTVMIENQMVWSYAYFRYVERMSDILKTVPSLGSIIKYLAKLQGPKYFKKRFQQHGIARHSTEEVYKFGMEDIQALSDYLGEKKYIFGDKMTTVDCCVFAHLSQLLYNGIDYPHRDYMQRHCQNLVHFVERIRADIWPDWMEVSERNLL